MKQINFRIVELPTHQVLLMKDWEDEVSNIVVIFFHDGMRITQTLGYDSESRRDKVFLDMPKKLIQEVVNDALQMFG